MAIDCCPLCKRKFPAPKVASAPAAEPDKATMTDAEIFAYCKRIGVREDVRFFLKVAAPLRADLRTEAEALLAELSARASKPADVKILNRIRDAYRIERNYLHRAQAIVGAFRLKRKLAKVGRRIVPTWTQNVSEVNHAA